MPLKITPDIARIYLLLGAFLIALPGLVSLYKGDTGKLLVATGVIQGEPFERSVILVGRHSLAGAFGVILNKELTEEQWERRPDLKNLNVPVLYGGPVNFPVDVIVVKVPSNMQELTTEKLATLLKDDPNFLSNLKSGASLPYDVQLYVGYAGWNALQLEAEKRRKAWVSIDADPDIFFAALPDMWTKAIKNALETHPLAEEGI